MSMRNATLLPILLVCGLVFAGPSVVFGQSTAADQTSASQNQTAPDAQAAQGTDQKSSGAQDDKPGALGRLKRKVRNQMSDGCVNVMGSHCWDKPVSDDAATQKGAAQAQSKSSKSSDNLSPKAGESSSKSTKLDLSPPPGEFAAPGVGMGPDTGDVSEFKPWNPHRADKNVEVGDFYFKRGNYMAAASRYEEALYWYDKDAIAMFRLAQSEEKLGKQADAKKHYEGYLKILPQGEFSEEARSALSRLAENVQKGGTSESAKNK